MANTHAPMPPNSALEADRALFAKALNLMASRGVFVHGALDAGSLLFYWSAYYDRYCLDEPPAGLAGVFWHADCAKETFGGWQRVPPDRRRCPLHLFWSGDEEVLQRTLREVGITVINPRSHRDPLSQCFPSSTDWFMPY